MSFNLGAIVTFDDLIALLERHGAPGEVDDAIKAVIVPTKLGDDAGEAWLRWDDEHGLFVCFVPLDIDVAEAHVDALCRAIIRLNHGLAVLGFGYDDDQGVVYYRASIGFDPTLGLDEEVVHQLYATAASTAARFCTALAEVAAGERSPTDVVPAQ